MKLRDLTHMILSGYQFQCLLTPLPSRVSSVLVFAIVCGAILKPFRHFSLLDTLIGEKGRNRKSLECDTRCKIRVSGLDADNRGGKWWPIEVEVTGHDLQRAREIIENKILSTVRREDKGKMLYYLAKYNHYGGSSDGIARYQRSPEDLNRRVWMAVVHVRSDFHKYSRLFISKNSSGISQIEEDTKCRFIHVVSSQPTYIFLSDSKLEAVNEATYAVKKRLGQVARRYKALPRFRVVYNKNLST
jgi:hypothetical protein